jgi:esterase/lipase
VLIVTGKRDEIIPCERSLTLFERARQPKSLLVLQNSSHNNFSADLKLFIAGMSNFFSSLRRVG